MPTPGPYWAISGSRHIQEQFESRSWLLKLPGTVLNEGGKAIGRSTVLHSLEIYGYRRFADETSRNLEGNGFKSHADIVSACVKARRPND
jgi:hypothetical protein